MIAKPLEQIAPADILALIADCGVEESTTLDFKRELPIASEEAKRNLCIDVSAFANSRGGDLIFGIEELEGVAKEIVGLPRLEPDADVRRLQQILHAGIAPRVPGVQPHLVTVPGKGRVLVLRTPVSWNGPHMVKVNDCFRIYGRAGKANYMLDPAEIRAAFVLSEQLPERMQRWRDDRLAKIMADETPVRLAPGPKLVVHVLPVASFGRHAELPVHAIVAKKTAFAPFGAFSWNSRLTIDGLLSDTLPEPDSGRTNAYCQVFRSGCIEAVKSRFATDREGKTVIGCGSFEGIIVEVVDRYVTNLLALGGNLPIIAFVTFLGVKGAYVWAGFGSGYDAQALDRDVVILPEGIIQDTATPVSTALRSMFDATWNAAGAPASPNFSEDGVWRPRQSD